MAKLCSPFLFSWDAIEARTDLDRFFLVRDNLPDEKIIQYLEVMRGNGRDDYPVRPMWNTLIAGIVFQHPSIEHLIRELSRNPSLLEACGFNPLPIQKKPETKLVTSTLTGTDPPLLTKTDPPDAQRLNGWWCLTLT